MSLPESPIEPRFSSVDDVAAFITKLDVPSFEEFLKHLFDKDPLLVARFAGLTRDLTSQELVSAVLDSADAITKSNGYTALERIVLSYEASKNHLNLERLLHFARLIRDPIAIATCCEMYMKSDDSSPLRPHIISYIANFPSELSQRFLSWLNNESIFVNTPPKIVIWATRDWRKAFRAINEIRTESYSQYIPIFRHVVRCALLNGGDEFVRREARSLSSDARRFLNEILALDEFLDCNGEAITLDAASDNVVALNNNNYIRPVDATESSWMGFVRKVGSNGQLKMVDFGYAEQELFTLTNSVRPYVARPQYKKNLALALQESIRESLPSDFGDRRLRIKWESPINIERVVEEMLSCDVFCAEPAHGTARRYKQIDMLYVGEVKFAAALAHKAIVEDWRYAFDRSVVHSEVTSDSIETLENNIDGITPMSEFISHVIENSIELMMQSGTAILDIIESDRQWIASLQPGRKRGNFTRIDSHLQRFVKMLELVHLGEGAEKIAAILDYPTAASIVSGSKRNGSREELDILPLRLESPIEAGYFVQRGDAEFASRMREVLERSVFRGGVWDEEFADAMARSLIKLDASPFEIVGERRRKAVRMRHRVKRDVA